MIRWGKKQTFYFLLFNSLTFFYNKMRERGRKRKKIYGKQELVFGIFVVNVKLFVNLGGPRIVTKEFIFLNLSYFGF